MSSHCNENKNVIYNTIKSVCSIIYPLITFPYVSRVLMAENLGKINFGNSIVSYCSLIATLGITTYGVRECAKYKDDRQRLGETTSQILTINALSMLVAYILLGLALMFVKPLENYRILICIQSSAVLFTTMGSEWLNTAMEDFRFITIRTVGMQVLSLILMFLFVKEPDHYIRYAIISVVASSGASVVNIFYRKKYCKIRFTVHLNLKKHLKPILLLFSMIVSQSIYYNFDITMLGIMRGDFEVGLYSVSFKIYIITKTLIASVGWVVIPKLSVYFSQGSYEEINRLLKYSMNFLVVLGFPCLMGVNIIAVPMIDVLAGAEYVAAATALHILTIALAFSLLGSWIGDMTMIPAGNEKICVLSSAISTIVNVILNLIFIPKWGLNAAAATSAFAEIVGVLTKLPYMDKRIRIDGFREIVKAPLIGSIGILIIGTIVKNVFESSLVITAITIITSILFYGFVLIIMKNKFALSFINSAG